MDERNINIHMDGWSSCYITYHVRQRMKVYQFSSIYPWHILQIWCDQYECDPLGCLCNGRPTLYMHPWMIWEGCQHVNEWWKLMVHAILYNVEAKHVRVFIHPCWPIIWVLCGQYGCDPLAWLLVQCHINLIHASTWQGCQHLMIGVHGTLYIHTTQCKG